MSKIKLIQTRLAKGLSQEEIADLIGMSQSNYSRRESGRTNITEIEWQRIAKELGVEKEIIFEPEEQNKEKRDEINMLYFNIPDFVMQHIELLKKENKKLKEQLKKLKNL
ncbi:helix-turn-helix transcriptional regulator [Flavobacterium sp. ov086]|uniref:helix-turn-helix transcriptional regulator n=1 Tax=Flavobacterium sp. ov086 TaxID=1761785 RepID=UPI000B68F1A4|nr:helix-turn-helix transcriptional regulator [Flavobacterium sp. ov086]SNR86859.1 Helix-turn-helix [Flavobacterium sp. ov086]